MPNNPRGPRYMVNVQYGLERPVLGGSSPPQPGQITTRGRKGLIDDEPVHPMPEKRGGKRERRGNAERRVDGLALAWATYDGESKKREKVR